MTVAPGAGADAAAGIRQGLEAAIASLDQHPASNPVTAESSRLRHLLNGKRPHVDGIVYSIDQRRRLVSVVHIRHDARDHLTPAR